MEIRINREIREYTESMFFGLSLRQFVFSVLACGMAVGIYFLLNPVLGTETTSWLCIVAAFPFAVMGFLKYNGMTAEKFIAAWIRSTFMIPKRLTFGNTNYYYAMLRKDSATGKSKGGDIIFFDWDSDGELDHVGIVESCDGRIVHTIEGNSGDACRRRSYVRGRAPIKGYGLIFTTPSNKAQLIAAKAIDLAYPDARTGAKYPSGSPTASYAAALSRAYPKRLHWGAATKAGASCDVFVGVVVVDSGVDPTYPRGLSEQRPYMNKSKIFKCVINTSSRDIKESELRDGDIITYSYTKGGGHICIYAGGKLRHAAYDKWYPRTTSLGGRLKISGKNWIRVYRAVG